MANPRPVLEQQQSQMVRMISYNNSPMSNDKEEDISALSAFRTKEEEIKKKKMEVREKVQAHLGRVEEETKRLAEIREELESLTDPTRKEVAIVRKRIDLVNRELRPLRQSCLKKNAFEEPETLVLLLEEKEYKEAIEAFNEKNKEKAQLVTKLMEMVSESERVRMKKLEELSKNIDSIS